MSYQQTFTCDICGAVKQETNHWVLAWRPELNDEKLYFTKWSSFDARVANVVHLCGAECAAKHLSNYLGKLKEGK